MRDFLVIIIFSFFLVEKSFSTNEIVEEEPLNIIHQEKYTDGFLESQGVDDNELDDLRIRGQSPLKIENQRSYEFNEILTNLYVDNDSGGEGREFFVDYDIFNTIVAVEKNKIKNHSFLLMRGMQRFNRNAEIPIEPFDNINELPQVFKTPDVGVHVENLIRYIDSAEAEKCKESAKPTGWVQIQDDFEDSKRLNNFKIYKENCGIYNIKNYVNNTVDDLSERIVVLFNNERIFCTGFILSDTSIVTARHCIYPKNEHAIDFMVAINDESETIIYDYYVDDSACNNIYQMINEHRHKSIQSCDYIFLKSKKLVANRIYSKFSIAEKVSAKDKLVIVGFHFRNLLYMRKVLGDRKARWKNGIIVADSPMCITLEVKNYLGNDSACFAHGCQTTQGMSGSPIFIVSDSGLKFAGVQIGTTKFDENAWFNDQYICYSEKEVTPNTKNLAVYTKPSN